MDELNPNARAVVDMARDARTPDDADKARIKAALAASIVAGTVGAGAAGSKVAASTAVAGATKTGVGGKAASGALAAVWVKWAAVATVAAGVGVGGFVLSSEPDPRRLDPAPARTVAPSPVVEQLPTRAAPPDEASPPAAAAVPKPEGTDDQADPPPARRRRRVARRPIPEVAPEPAPASPDLAGELTLLHTAQQAWRAGRFHRALELTAEHQRSFPRSQLASERQALRVLALCGVGRTAEARRLGKGWLASATRSPLRASVEESCAGSPAPE